MNNLISIEKRGYCPIGRDYCPGVKEAQDWISVEDRLPEPGEDVLAFVNKEVDGETYRRQGYGWLGQDYLGGPTWIVGGIIEPCYAVTHWQPRPPDPPEDAT